MKIHLTLLAALLALIGYGLAWDGGAARADEGAKGTSLWLYEVRVVRVDPPTAAGAEAPSPFPEMKGTTTDLAWPALLARLRQRGATTILMDSQTSSVTGVKSTASEESSAPIVALNFEDVNNQQFRAQLVKRGATFEQTSNGAFFQYALEIRGLLTPPAAKNAPVQYHLAWNAAHPALAGETLVLSHRRQVAQPKGDAKALEHYAFITGRQVAAR